MIKEVLTVALMTYRKDLVHEMKYEKYVHLNMVRGDGPIFTRDKDFKQHFEK